MKTSDFDYRLPQEKIAYRPLKDRQSSKLLVLDKQSGSIDDRIFSDLSELLNPEDVLIFNNTKVIPARIYGSRESGAHTEVLLLERLGGNRWKCILRKPKSGAVVEFEDGLKGTLYSDGQSEWIIEFNREVDSYLENYGKMPLPPYIKREADKEDRSTYQTVYAEIEGAAAAPTAGLHFTNDLITGIKSMGVEIGYVTLHVGLGTFLPVKVEDVSKHRMHKEYIEVPVSTEELVNRAKAEGRRVVAVGTTVVRTLESLAYQEGKLRAGSARTDLFITPGYGFKIVNALITNFHQPRSTLLMLVSALAGRDNIMIAYNHALQNEYRFLSYGDAMFIS